MTYEQFIEVANGARQMLEIKGPIILVAHDYGVSIEYPWLGEYYTSRSFYRDNDNDPT